MALIIQTFSLRRIGKLEPAIDNADILFAQRSDTLVGRY
jgi:hypothetical protein